MSDSATSDDANLYPTSVTAYNPRVSDGVLDVLPAASSA